MKLIFMHKMFHFKHKNLFYNTLETTFVVGTAVHIWPPAVYFIYAHQMFSVLGLLLLLS